VSFGNHAIDDTKEHGQLGTPGPGPRVKVLTELNGPKVTPFDLIPDSDVHNIWESGDACRIQHTNAASTTITSAYTNTNAVRADVLTGELPDYMNPIASSSS